MAERWRMLAVLFLARAAMGLQFQAAAALSPLMMARYEVGLADVGLLIGLYLSPGVLIAAPGGAIGRALGDKRAVALGMALMLAGAVIAALAESWSGQIAGRAVAGVGGVMLNVLMAKMVTDWFEGRELATAMGLFVNSWPVGIALALVALPPLAVAAGLGAALAAVALCVAGGLALLLAGYRAPDGAAASQAAPGPARLRGAALACVLIAGAIWGLYNAALGMIFSFGPALLAERGWSAAEAGSAAGLALWIVALSVPLGGVLADRLGRRDGVLFAGLAIFAAAMLAAPYGESMGLVFAALGAVGGLAAGPAMSLPADVLRAETRAFGMGLFFTLFYVAAVLAPILGGRLADAVGDAGSTFQMGGAMLIACCALLGAFRALRPRAARARG